jgi:hypothetical protein
MKAGADEAMRMEANSALVIHYLVPLSYRAPTNIP